jgi:hypothetical protein
MRMKFKLFLVLVTIHIGCTGVPLFAHPNFPAKASRNAATEIHGHRDGVPQFWRQFEDPMLNRLIADGISSNKDPAIAAYRIREARAMHRGYALSPFPLTTNPVRIAALEPISARRGGVRSDLPDADLFDPGFDSLWEINFFSADRNSTEIADAVYAASAYDLRAIQVSLEGEIQAILRTNGSWRAIARQCCKQLRRQRLRSRPSTTRDHNVRDSHKRCRPARTPQPQPQSVSTGA